jgi:hypothetical protein
MLVQVDLHFAELGGVQGCQSEKYSGGYAVLSSHNLLWVDASASGTPGRSCSLPLACIKEATLRASHVFATPKLCVHVLCDAQGQPRPGSQHSEQVPTPILWGD